MTNKFVSALTTQATVARKTTTTNGMVTYNTSEKPLVDLFFQIGSSRGKDISPLFLDALRAEPVNAAKVLLWSRDVRAGAGERAQFRKLINVLANQDPILASRVIAKIPELGRWDDVLAIENADLFNNAAKMWLNAVRSGDRLAAKWAPRKGAESVRLRNAWELSPRSYRKMIVAATNVVETQMCAKQWSDIDYNHVPSVASSRYSKAFARNDSDRYFVWKNGLEKGVDKFGNAVKVNADAIYPYDIIRSLRSSGQDKVANAQWAALPNWMDNRNVLAMVDVSGSMGVTVSPNITALDVAVSLGLYVADKTKGAFKDTFLTFSTTPELLHLTGSLSEKMRKMNKSHWDMSTNLEGAFNAILRHAIANSVPQSDMPATLIILSDMQFNSCVTNRSATAFQMARVAYANAGYNMPNIVFWNINAQANQSPVRHDENGVALVSGFSPSIVKQVLSKDMDPYNIVLKTISNPRYAI